jgi:pimeloyl-ACP methyl ester carboxylesterase
MPQPQRLEEFWAGMETYNTMTASKELFASIKCPVLLMAGELDRNALPTVINAYNMIPNAQLSIILIRVMFVFGKFSSNLDKYCSFFEKLNVDKDYEKSVYFHY